MTRPPATATSRTKLAQQKSFFVGDILDSGSLSKKGRQNRFVINPEQSRFLQIWDIVTISALVFVAVVTPVQVAMIETQIDFIFVFNLFIDAIFVVDMVLQFFMMYSIKSHFGNVLEHRHSKIAIRYLKTWFLLDFFSILPYDVVSLSLNNPHMSKLKAVKTIRLLRLLKLMRVMKASRLFRRMEVNMSLTYQRLALFKFCLLLALSAHWMACLWAMTLELVDEDEGVPRWIEDISDLEKGLPIKTKDSPMRLYIASLYFTGYTLTSVGYGDIGPKNLLERVVCTAIIFASGISWAIILGGVCGTISNMSAEAQEFSKTMDNLNSMMKDKGLPRNMCRRIRAYFLSTRGARKAAEQRHILERMSPALRGEVAMALNQIWLIKVRWLGKLVGKVKRRTGKEPAFMVDMALALMQSAYCQQEVFGRPHVLYIVVRGLVSQNERVLRSGAVWGEDFILQSTHLLKTAEGCALTYVEVSHMDRSTFMRIVDGYRNGHPELRQCVRHHANWLTLQRAILLEARKRQNGRLNRRGPRWLSFNEDIQTLAAQGEHPSDPHSIQHLAKQLNEIQASQITLEELVRGCPYEVRDQSNASMPAGPGGLWHEPAAGQQDAPRFRAIHPEQRVLLPGSVQ